MSALFVYHCVLTNGWSMLAVIPSIEMAAAGLDSIGAIVGYAICSGISITSGSLVYSILSGPLQVPFSAVAPASLHLMFI